MFEFLSGINFQWHVAVELYRWFWWNPQITLKLQEYSRILRRRVKSLKSLYFGVFHYFLECSLSGQNQAWSISCTVKYTIRSPYMTSKFKAQTIWFLLEFISRKMTRSQKVDKKFEGEAKLSRESVTNK